MALRFDLGDPGDRERGLAAACSALRRGAVVAAPLDQGYALLADAFSDLGVAALRRARGRPDLAPQVIVGRIRAVAGIATVPRAAHELMVDFWPGPLTLLLTSHPSLAWPTCTPGGQVAVRMPLHPGALELATAFGPLAAVPAGPPGCPALESLDEVVVGLPDAAAVLLDGGLVARGPASTVVRATTGRPRVVREGAYPVALLAQSCPGLGSADEPA